MQLRFLASTGAVLSLALAVQAQHWQPDPQFQPVLQSADGSSVTFTPAPGGKVFVSAPLTTGGGLRRRNLARLNADGTIDASFAPPDSDRLELLDVYPDGRVLVRRIAGDAGSFVRLLTDGSVDPGFSYAVPGWNYTFSAKRRADDRIVYFGPLESSPGVVRRGLALLEADGTPSRSFHGPTPVQLESTLSVVPLPDGHLIGVGNLSIGAVRRDNLFRLNADGSLDPGFDAAGLGLGYSNPLQAVYPLPDSRILILAGSRSIGFSRVNADGSDDETFAKRALGSASGFIVSPTSGKIYYRADGTSVRRLNADGTTDATFLIADTAALGELRALGEDGSLFFLWKPDAGDLLGSALRHAHADGRRDTGYASPRFGGTSADAFASLPDGRVLVAGPIGYVGDTSLGGHRNIVRLNSDGTLDASLAAPLTMNETVDRIVVQPDGRAVALRSDDYAFARFTTAGARDPGFQRDELYGERLAATAAGSFYYQLADAAGVIRLRRYTPDGARDPAFACSLPVLGPVAAFDDGTSVMTTTVGGATTLVRLARTGAVDAGFAADPDDVPPNLTGLVSIPGGQVVAVGYSLAGTAGYTLRIARFGSDGATRQQFFSPRLSSGVQYQAVWGSTAFHVGGALLDALRAAGAAPTARVRADLPFPGCRVALDVSADGKLTTLIENRLARWVRTGSPDPGMAAAPTILAQTFGSATALLPGETATLGVEASGILPLTYQWLKDDEPIAGAESASLRLVDVRPADAGAYALRVTNGYGSTTTAATRVAVGSAEKNPTLNWAVTASSTRGNFRFGDACYLSPNGRPASSCWYFNGEAIAGPTPPAASNVTLSFLAPETAGLYQVEMTDDEGRHTAGAVALGLNSTDKARGDAAEVGPNIRHPNGNLYDQLLLDGPAVTITADNAQVSRLSFIDPNDDIVQVEFSGPGSLSLVLLDATGPARPVNYSQDISYMKGRAGIVIRGATESTHVSIFTVGRATAFDPSGTYDIVKPPGPANDPARNGSPLFAGHGATDYDGMADIAFIAFDFTYNFGGLRAANVRFGADKGLTGIYAPLVAFAGPVYVGDIDARFHATPVLIVRSAGDARICGGDLAQTNGQAVQVNGLTRLAFTAGADSAGTALPAQRNRGRLEQDGNDITDQIVANPAP